MGENQGWALILEEKKNEKAEEFAREIKGRHEKTRAALVKLQKEMKRQVDRSRKEVEEYRVNDKVLISTSITNKILTGCVTGAE